MISTQTLLILIARTIFYLKGVAWVLKGKRARSMQEVLKLFYMDFLQIEKKHIEVVKLTDDELVARCNNPCPILDLALRFRLDTKYFCKKVSEPVCKFVLSSLNPNLVFERNYEHIRPYAKSCEERIYWRKN
ncbi:MAG: hypothetical protein QXS51_00010 [Thermoproteota archaeon]